MQLSTRSIRLGSRETPLAAKLGCPQVARTSLPEQLDARSSLQLHNNLGGGAGIDQPSRGSLHRASFLRHAQKRAVRLPLHRLPPASPARKRRVPEKAPPKLCALEEETRTQLQKDPPPHQLDLDKFELENGSCNHRVQLRKALEAMHQAVHSLDAKLAKADKSSKQNNNNNNNNNNNDDNTTTTNNMTTSTTTIPTTITTTTDNNNNNNNNNNNKNSRESGLQSFDLDKTNPESKPDLDGESLGSFTQTMGDESSPTGLDHQEASLSFNNLGHNKTMTIGLSLGSFSQNQDGQEGKRVGSAYSFDSQRAKLGQKPSKRVTFGTVTWKAYNPQGELQNENNKRATCWDSFQQENAKQQQTATASEKELQHKACQQQQQNNSLGREEQTLGNIQQACRCPSDMNNSNLGTTTKNTAAWGILVDTGAAISLAPLAFAPESELRPVESTLQLRSANGSLIETYGRRSVQLVGSELCLHVSFVVAKVEQALIGMDVLIANQLSLIRTSLQEYYLVNSLGAKTKLQTRGLQLYMPVWPPELGLSTLRGSSFQDHSESLLDDKVRTQDRALATSGGACYDSLPLENLREQQAKNTATLGTTTACQEKGAKRRRKKKKKPSAKTASQDPSRSEEL